MILPKSSFEDRLINLPNLILEYLELKNLPSRLYVLISYDPGPGLTVTN